MTDKELELKEFLKEHFPNATNESVDKAYCLLMGGVKENDNDGGKGIPEKPTKPPGDD